MEAQSSELGLPWPLREQPSIRQPAVLHYQTSGSSCEDFSDMIFKIFLIFKLYI